MIININNNNLLPHPKHRPCRHGLTLIEFMLAITITSMVALGIASLMAAVAQGTEFDRYQRETNVRAQALSVRISSYIIPALNILDNTSSSMVIWLDDHQISDTVNTTEIRWIEHDVVSNSVLLYYIEFPEGWSQSKKDLYDIECPMETNWWQLLSIYEGLGYTKSFRFSDDIANFKVERNLGTIPGKRLATFTVTFTPTAGSETIVFEASIREPKEPVL